MLIVLLKSAVFTIMFQTIEVLSYSKQNNPERQRHWDSIFPRVAHEKFTCFHKLFSGMSTFWVCFLTANFWRILIWGFRRRRSRYFPFDSYGKQRSLTHVVPRTPPLPPSKIASATSSRTWCLHPTLRKPSTPRRSCGPGPWPIAGSSEYNVSFLFTCIIEGAKNKGQTSECFS